MRIGVLILSDLPVPEIGRIALIFLNFDDCNSVLWQLFACVFIVQEVTDLTTLGMESIDSTRSSHLNFNMTTS